MCEPLLKPLLNPTGKRCVVVGCRIAAIDVMGERIACKQHWQRIPSYLRVRFLRACRQVERTGDVMWISIKASYVDRVTRAAIEASAGL